MLPPVTRARDLITYSPRLRMELNFVARKQAFNGKLFDWSARVLSA